MADSPTPDADAPEMELVIDGETFTADDLTFREQRDMRKVLRTELMDDPSEDVTDANVSDFYLALIYVVKRRQSPELTIEDVLDLKLSDFLQEARPTKRPAARGAKAKT